MIEREAASSIVSGSDAAPVPGSIVMPLGWRGETLDHACRSRSDNDGPSPLVPSGATQPIAAIVQPGDVRVERVEVDRPAAAARTA